MPSEPEIPRGGHFQFQVVCLENEHLGLESWSFLETVSSSVSLVCVCLILCLPQKLRWCRDHFGMNDLFPCQPPPKPGDCPLVSQQTMTLLWLCSWCHYCHDIYLVAVCPPYSCHSLWCREHCAAVWMLLVDGAGKESFGNPFDGC